MGNQTHTGKIQESLKREPNSSKNSTLQAEWDFPFKHTWGKHETCYSKYM